MRKSIVLLLLMACVSKILAQETTYTLELALATAMVKNESLKAVRWEEKQQSQLKKTSFSVPKTNFSWMTGQYNGFPSDNNLTITQSIPFTVWGSQAALNRSLAVSGEMKRVMSENELSYNVKSVYYRLAFTKAQGHMFQKHDSTLDVFARASAARYRTGEGTLLEKTTAETQRNEMLNRLNMNLVEQKTFQLQLQVLIGVNELPQIDLMYLPKLSWNLPFADLSVDTNPHVILSAQQTEVASGIKKVERANLGPELLLGYFNQTLIGSIDPENGNVASKSNRFSGFQVGVGLPLFFGAQMARVKAANYNQKAAESQHAQLRNQMFGELKKAILEYDANKKSLEYYESSALPNAQLILKQASSAYKQGEISTSEFLLQFRQVLEIQSAYLSTLNAYNQSILYLEFLSAKK